MDSDRKNILFMVQLPPPVHGAALRNKSLMESKVINENFRVIPLPLHFASGLKDIGSFSIRKVFITFGYFVRLIKTLLKNRIDLAYFTMSPSGWAFYRDLFFVTVLKLFRVKILYHFRVKGFRKTSGSALGRKMVKYAFRNAHIVCLSQHHVEDLNNLYSGKPFIVPNGIKVELHDHSFVHLPGSGPVKILFISNLAQTKGVFDLLEALKILHGQGFNFNAQVVGAEHDVTYDELNDFIGKNGLSQKVFIPGAQYGENKNRLLSEADIFVLPTYFELFPGVILEAMQFGKAIIATIEGSIPEMIDNKVNGILVPKQDPVSLSVAIRELLDNPAERSMLGKSAQEKFFAYFTMEKFEVNMKGVFESVLQ